jgi:leucyl-tRNA synthetase
VSRVWRLALRHAVALAKEARGAVPGVLSGEARALRRKVHQTIKRVTQDIDERMHLNTAVAALQELLNEIERVEGQVDQGPPRAALREAVETLVLLLNPITPHLCEEVWGRLGNQGGLVRAPWPTADADVAREDELELPVQVNGKVRTRITVAREAAEAGVRESALAAAASHISGREVQKVIVVPGRLVNIVAR